MEVTSKDERNSVFSSIRKFSNLFMNSGVVTQSMYIVPQNTSKDFLINCLNNQRNLKQLMMNKNSENYVPYDDLYNYNKKLLSFLKLIFIRKMREDRTIICATQHFIPTFLDDKFFLNLYLKEIKDI